MGMALVVVGCDMFAVDALAEDVDTTVFLAADSLVGDSKDFSH